MRHRHPIENIFLKMRWTIQMNPLSMTQRTIGLESIMHNDMVEDNILLVTAGGQKYLGTFFHDGNQLLSFDQEKSKLCLP